MRIIDMHTQELQVDEIMKGQVHIQVRVDACSSNEGALPIPSTSKVPVPIQIA